MTQPVSVSLGRRESAPCEGAEARARPLIAPLREEIKKEWGKEQGREERRGEKKKKKKKKKKRRNVRFGDVAEKVQDGGCPTTFCKRERKCSRGKNGEEENGERGSGGTYEGEKKEGKVAEFKG